MKWQLFDAYRTILKLLLFLRADVALPFFESNFLQFCVFVRNVMALPSMFAAASLSYIGFETIHRSMLCD